MQWFPPVACNFLEKSAKKNISVNNKSCPKVKIQPDTISKYHSNQRSLGLLHYKKAKYDSNKSNIFGKIGKN